jgi:alkanesulfonate monooxygenase SsuD/methylene tetrahydromethanopterin reductase-like flavin-dependent oxidoreductase (luciferase family)
MKYALFDYYHGPNHPRKFAEHIEQWAFADGFMNYAFVAEHHFDGDFACCPSPGPLLGAVSQVTSRMRLAPWALSFRFGILFVFQRKSFSCTTRQKGV